MSYPQWEYRVQNSDESTRVTDTLNEAGREGWILSYVTNLGTLVFYRPLMVDCTYCDGSSRITRDGAIMLCLDCENGKVHGYTL